MSASVRRLRPSGRGNEALPEPLDELGRAAMIAAATTKLEELFDILSIDHGNDHNMRGTPRRVAKMFVEELFAGRYGPPPSITEFENALGYDDLIVTGPIDLRSTCAHHLMPIVGHVFVGVVPSKQGRIIGLSKYDRIVSYFASRLQIQEELVKQIAQYIDDMTRPKGLAVRVSAVHMCKTQRGVRASQRSRMVSSVYHGSLHDDAALKQRFLQECIGLERGFDL
jgi:GTP cyclohydrolase I